MDSKEKIIKLIAGATKVEASKITEATSFVDDLNLDSLDMVEMMMKMEDEFDIEIPEEKTESLKTVGDVLKYLETAKG